MPEIEPKLTITHLEDLGRHAGWNYLYSLIEQEYNRWRDSKASVTANIEHAGILAIDRAAKMEALRFVLGLRDMQIAELRAQINTNEM